MRFIHFLFTGLLVLALLVTAQGELNNLPPGEINIKRHVFSDAAIEHDVFVDVILPSGYQQSTKAYPVIYVLDGQRYGLMAAGAMQSLAHFERMPEAIVVSIYFIDQQIRRQTLTRLSDEFNQFLQQQLIVLVNKSYRTSGDEIIFGWQQAGTQALKLLANKPQLFDAYISASGNSRFSEDTPVRFLSDFVASNYQLPVFVFATMAESEHWIADEYAALDEFIANNSNKHLTAVVERYDDEDHWSTAYKTLYRGLRRYYHDYEPLQFSSLKELKNAGDLPYVQDFYKNRAKRYGTSEKVPDKTRFSMLTGAMRADDIASFDKYLTAFDDYFYGVTSPFWLQRYGDFYAKHQMPVKALAVYKISAERFVKTPSAIADYGKALVDSGNRMLGIKMLQKAVELAKTQGDDTLATYQQLLEQAQKGKKGT